MATVRERQRSHHKRDALTVHAWHHVSERHRAIRAEECGDQWESAFRIRQWRGLLGYHLKIELRSHVPVVAHRHTRPPGFLKVGTWHAKSRCRSQPCCYRSGRPADPSDVQREQREYIWELSKPSGCFTPSCAASGGGATSRGGCIQKRSES